MAGVPSSWRLPVLLLSLCWCLCFSVLTACAATINLAGARFSTSAYHTVPLALTTFSSGLFNLVLPFELRAFGRWRAYLLGALVGCVGGLTCFAACESASMLLLCVGAVLIGIGLSHAQNYRFGVVLCVPDPANHPIAISWVLAGGVAGAVIGPEYAKHTHELTAAPFAGVFLLAACCFGLVFAVLLCSAVPLRGLAESPAAVIGLPRRPLRVVFAQPRCAAATVVGAISYAVMVNHTPNPNPTQSPTPTPPLTLSLNLTQVFLMAAVPLAIKQAGFDFAQSSTVVQVRCCTLTLPLTLTLNPTATPVLTITLALPPTRKVSTPISLRPRSEPVGRAAPHGHVLPPLSSSP